MSSELYLHLGGRERQFLILFIFSPNVFGLNTRPKRFFFTPSAKKQSCSGYTHEFVKLMNNLVGFSTVHVTTTHTTSSQFFYLVRGRGSSQEVFVKNVLLQSNRRLLAQKSYVLFLFHFTVQALGLFRLHKFILYFILFTPKSLLPIFQC